MRDDDPMRGPGEEELPAENLGGLPAEDLDALRAAFTALPAPAPARELAQEDELTRRTVAWVAAAFQSMPVPLSVPPTRRDAPERLATVRPLASLRSARRLAAAAALLAVALGATWWMRDRTPRLEVQPPVSQAPNDTEVAPAPTLVAVAPDLLELTSGPVRLLMFTNPPQPSRETPR